MGIQPYDKCCMESFIPLKTQWACPDLITHFLGCPSHPDRRGKEGTEGVNDDRL